MAVLARELPGAALGRIRQGHLRESPGAWVSLVIVEVERVKEASSSASVDQPELGVPLSRCTARWLNVSARSFASGRPGCLSARPPVSTVSCSANAAPSSSKVFGVRGPAGSGAASLPETLRDLRSRLAPDRRDSGGPPVPDPIDPLDGDP